MKKKDEIKIDKNTNIDNEIHCNEKPRINERTLNNSIFDLTKNPTTDEDTDRRFGETIRAWFDKKFLHFKTRLTSEQVVALTILRTLAKKYKIKCIMQLLDNFVMYKLSEGGKSAEELVTILKNQQQYVGDDELARTINAFAK